MLTLVRRARRRLFGNELLSQGANAASAALIALILLLLFGTQVLDWRWAVLIPAAAAATGLYRARQRRPTLYAAAQIVDHRMALADTLSTALFFSEAGATRVSPEICQCQFERASQVAESVDVRKATPYTMPRAIYVLAALTLVASSLFALRYGLSRRLDLKPPLARLLQQSMGFNQRTELARDVRRNPPQASDPQDDSAAAILDQDQKAVGDPDPTADNTSDGSSQPDAAQSKASQGDPGKQGKKSDQSGEGEQDAQAENGADPKDGAASGAGQQGNSKADQKQPSGGKPDANSSGENPSLLSKVKEAMQNLLSRMKPQAGEPGQQSGMDQKGPQGKGRQNDGKQQQSARNGQPQNSGQQGDSQEGQAGQDAQSSQDPQGKGTGKTDSEQAGKQPGRGIGSQDGDKRIRQAEQLAAMGKISEILGKRSANITGEATVEVHSTSQQLRTPYAPRGAQHTQGGTEISRDEIPVALQAYVEQYFEQVRKQAPPKK